MQNPRTVLCRHKSKYKVHTQNIIQPSLSSLPTYYTSYPLQANHPKNPTTIHATLQTPVHSSLPTTATLPLGLPLPLPAAFQYPFPPAPR